MRYRITHREAYSDLPLYGGYYDQYQIQCSYWFTLWSWWSIGYPFGSREKAETEMARLISEIETPDPYRNAFIFVLAVVLLCVAGAIIL